MIKVVVGSMVLCHLLSGEPTNTQNQNSEQPPIIKILGKVIDIQKGSRYIEKVDERQALRADTNILIVKAENKEGVYQVDSRACMLVRDETLKEREERLYPKIKEEDADEDEEGKKPIVIDEEDKLEFIESSKNSDGLEIQDTPAIDASVNDVLEQPKPEKIEEKKPIIISKEKEIAPLPTPKEDIKKVIQEENTSKKEETKKEALPEFTEELKKKNDKGPSFFDYLR